MRCIIVGGGFGGLSLARSLKKAPLEITLIDKTNHHLFQPLLYQVATAALSPAQIATPLREIVKRQENTRVIMGEVISIEKEKQTVHLENGDSLAYDSLILAIGNEPYYFGHPEWALFTTPVKTLQNALQIREQIVYAYELAERFEDRVDVQELLTFVIIGAGPTGVEMAGAIAEIAHKTLRKNFRRVHPEKTKIVLIEGADHVLPPYPERLGNRAERDLETLGVKVLTKKQVTRIDEQGVWIQDELISTRNIFWAAGTRAPELLKSLDTPLDRQGRALVEPDLTVPGHSELFVIGDAACIKGKKGIPLPALSPVAIQQGNYVARILKKGLQTPRRPFRFFDKGSMATIGKNRAVALIGKLQMTGLAAWLAWCFIHIFYLISFRNRLLVMLDWIIDYFTQLHAARLIYLPIKKEDLSKF